MENKIERIELIDQGIMCGFIEYYSFDELVMVTHTEIMPEHEGKGYGSRLVRQALENFKAQAKMVVPVCGFFASYLRKHPEFSGCVSEESKRIFNL